MSRIHVMGPARTVAKARCRPTALPSSRSRCALPLPASARTWQSRFGVPAERLLVARRAHPVRWHAEDERALQVEKQLGDDGGVLHNARHASAQRDASGFARVSTLWLVCYPPSGRQQTQPLRIQTAPFRSPVMTTRFGARAPFSDILARCSLPNPPSPCCGRGRRGQTVHGCIRNGCLVARGAGGHG